MRELDKTRVKGKNQPVSIFELIDYMHNSLEQTTQDFLELYQEGRAAYTNMQFKKAIAIFEKAIVLKPTDRASAIHINRAQAYLVNPPPDDWDGVHTMTTK